MTVDLGKIERVEAVDGVIERLDYLAAGGAYRSPAVMPPVREEQTTGLRVGDGILFPKEPPVHVCAPPGFWARLWHRIEVYREWECDCGRRLQLVYGVDTVGNTRGVRWVKK